MISQRHINKKIKLHNKETGTYPIAVHFPGSSKRKSDKDILKRVFYNKHIYIEEKKLHDNFFIILPSNNKKHILCEQLIRNNIFFNMSCIIMSYYLS